MAQPTIIGIAADGNTRTYAADDDTSGAGSERVFSNISVPANANTMLVLVALNDSGSAEAMTNIALSGVTGASELYDLSLTPPTRYVSSRFAVFDVRGSGATSSGQITATIASTSTKKSLCGVVFTDGYVESFSLSQQRLLDDTCFSTVASSNMLNNIQVFMGMVDGSGLVDFNFSGTGVSDLYKTASSSSDISSVAAQQATTANNAKTISFSKGSEDVVYASILLSSQPNPLADIDPRGDIISHDIITN
tara:strand:+ start:539 stop:1288 length:750 start_codon:yes stop_codon:yes gene_type:complete